MHVLVTGGAGFIGQHVVRALRAAGHVATVLDLKEGEADTSIHGDIRDAEAVLAAAQGCQAIIHLAAVVSVEQLNKEPALAQSVNVRGSANVVAAAEIVGARLIAASTAAVYGINPEIPTPESAPLAPASPYGESKAVMERLILAAKVPSCILRFFNVYGPGQDPKSRYAAVIPTFLTQALKGEQLVIHGSGAQHRDFIYATDVARACLLALTRGAGTYNIGTGKATSINALAEHVLSLTQSTSVTTHDDARAGDPEQSRAATEKAANELGFRATIGIREGLSETLDAIRASAKRAGP